jgi:hypothetical protein
MANQNDTVQRAKDAPIPNANQLRSIIPRVVANLREDQRGTATRALENIASMLDSTVQAFAKKMRGQAWTDAGREYAAAEARAEAEAALRVLADSATKDHRDHMQQLDAELAEVPAINEFRATEIRSLLREMNRSERESFIAQSDDPEVLASIVHGPRSFPLASEQATERARLNFNRATRPDKVALRADTESFVSAVENYTDTVQRELKRVVR